MDQRINKSIGIGFLWLVILFVIIGWYFPFDKTTTNQSRCCSYKQLVSTCHCLLVYWQDFSFIYFTPVSSKSPEKSVQTWFCFGLLSRCGGTFQMLVVQPSLHTYLMSMVSDTFDLWLDGLASWTIESVWGSEMPKTRKRTFFDTAQPFLFGFHTAFLAQPELQNPRPKQRRLSSSELMRFAPIISTEMDTWENSAMGLLDESVVFSNTFIHRTNLSFVVSILAQWPHNNTSHNLPHPDLLFPSVKYRTRDEAGWTTVLPQMTIVHGS